MGLVVLMDSEFTGTSCSSDVIRNQRGCSSGRVHRAEEMRTFKKDRCDESDLERQGVNTCQHGGGGASELSCS